MPEISDGLILTWQIAGVEAGLAGSPTIEPGHFMVGLCKACDPKMAAVVRTAEVELSELSRVFHDASLDPTTCRRRLRAVLPRSAALPPGGEMHRSPESRRLFDRSESLCLAAGGTKMRPVHLLWALSEIDGPWVQVLQEMSVHRDVLLAKAAAAAQEATAAAPPQSDSSQGTAERPTVFLNRFGRDVTRLAVEGKLPPVIGRRDEILELGRALLRQRRSNAILVGEPGVGKTCVVEGFAQRITRDDAADDFRGKRIIEISMPALLAGTRHRGDFEERIQGIIAEASSDPSIVLFIDEIHTVVGSGSSGDSMSAGDILKPALARGEIRCIGATTTREYRQFIEKDSALQRRFQTIWVEEPTRDETVEILMGLRESFQIHHGLEVTEEAVTAAVDISIRYAPDFRLPDKAIDLVDEACARARAETLSKLVEAKFVSRAEISRVAAQRYRVPLEDLTQDEASRLAGMEEALRLRVKGQEEAVSAVSEVVRAARAGLKRKDHPLGVFLFLGPTGTGKTELAKAVAQFLFGDEERLISIDMSEYTEKHNVSRLIGAPPGYVGYEQEGELTSKVRNHPYSVVLLDEIEKAHPDVHKLFLQVLGEARLTDSHGRRASFSETIIIMTSNLGASVAREHGPIGPGFPTGSNSAAQVGRLDRERTMAAVRGAMSPEFLNRIQRLVFFEPLSREAIREIADKVLATLSAQLRVVLSVDDAAYDLLMKEGYSAEYGAREMERTLDHLIGEPLTRLRMQGGLPEDARVAVRVEAGEMKFGCSGS